MLVSVLGEMRGEISHAPLNCSHFAMMFVILIKTYHQHASTTPELPTHSATPNIFSSFDWVHLN